MAVVLLYLIDGIHKPLWPNFHATYGLDRVIAAVVRSHEESRWVRIEEI